jgi:DNA-binding NarL/FixJ family response regulator
LNQQLSLIEDDHRIRKTLRLFIESNSQFKVISEHDRVEFFLAEKIKPDLLLLDIGLPGMSGIEGLPKIKNKHPELDVIMLTTYEEADLIFNALCAGACSYISKRTSMVKIVEALHIVSNGGSYMSPTIAKKVTSFFVKKPKQKVKLTERQTEIVKHIIDGLSYTEIAKTCFISVNTVRSHIKAVYKLLEVGSKLDLMKKYMDGEI